MQTLVTIFSPVIWLLGWIIAILWWIIAILWWIVSYLLWALLWLVLPVVLVAFVALRIAEKALGPDVVRGWVKKQSMKFGAGTWTRAHRLLFALGALPLRVLGWLIVYTLWHSIVSLAWKPRWHPWPRAWAKRWKPKSSTARTRTAKTH